MSYQIQLCDTCLGTGEARGKPCFPCFGTGRRAETAEEAKARFKREEQARKRARRISHDTL